MIDENMENQMINPGQMPAGKPQQNGVYPKDKDEVDKFIAGVISAIHDDSVRDQIMKQLTNTQIPIQVRIGNVVSQVMTALLAKVKQQSGRKPHLQLILKAIKLAVIEVAKMAEIAGQKTTPEEMKMAAGIAGQMIENGQQGPQGPPQQTPQPSQQMAPQQQGLIGGING